MKATATFVFALLLTVQAKEAAGNENVKTQGLNSKDFVVIADRNYYIHSTGETMNFVDALRLCNSMDMTIISLETLTEVNNVKDYLTNNGFDTLNFWTSGREIEVRYHWTGSGQMFTDENWDEEAFEPDYLAKSQCVQMTLGDKWASALCTSKLSLMCEQF